MPKKEPFPMSVVVILTAFVAMLLAAWMGFDTAALVLFVVNLVSILWAVIETRGSKNGGDGGFYGGHAGGDGGADSGGTGGGGGE